MKQKYVTIQVLLTTRTKPVIKKSIHEQIEETIAERRKIMGGMQQFSKAAKVMEMYLGVRAA